MKATTIVLPRVAAENPDKLPGPWWAPVSGNEARDAMFKCPNGHYYILSDNSRTIDDDGNVSPAVLCDTESCNFSGELTLDEWPLVRWATLFFVGGGPHDGRVEYHVYGIRRPEPTPSTKTEAEILEKPKFLETERHFPVDQRMPANQYHRYVPERRDGKNICIYVGVRCH